MKAAAMKTAEDARDAEFIGLIRIIGKDVTGYVLGRRNGTGASYQGMPSDMPLRIASDGGFSR